MRAMKSSTSARLGKPKCIALAAVIMLMLMIIVTVYQDPDIVNKILRPWDDYALYKDIYLNGAIGKSSNNKTVHLNLAYAEIIGRKVIYKDQFAIQNTNKKFNISTHDTKFELYLQKIRTRIFCSPNNSFDVALFPMDMTYASNIAHLLLDILPNIYYMSKIAHTNIFRKVDNIKIALIHPPFVQYSALKEAHHDILYLLNISEVIRMGERKGIFCFKYGIFSSNRGYNVEEIGEYYKGRLKSQECLHTLPLIVIIQREGNRKLENIEEITNLAIRMGFSVQVLFMESLSILDQMKYISCADLLIGVQGAALSWFYFLPKHAYFVEIGFDHWPNNFFSRKAFGRRSDLNIHNLNCEIYTPVTAWELLAKTWLGHNGNITDNIKNRIVELSYQQGTFATNIWKASNCRCKLYFFKEIFVKFKKERNVGKK